MSILRRIQGENQTNGNGQSKSGGSDSLRNPSIQSRRITAPTSSGMNDTYQDLKNRVQTKLLRTLDPSMDVTQTAEVKKTIQELFEQILNDENLILSRPERARMFEQISAEILGFGPLQSILEEEYVTEIMVNGAKNIYVERKGKIIREPMTFENNEHVMRIIERIVAPLGRRIDESSPICGCASAGWFPCECCHSSYFIGWANIDHS